MRSLSSRLTPSEIAQVFGGLTDGFEDPKPEVIKLDWKGYFQNFSREHGGNPIQHQGRLLFADGWTYACSDYAGPEWPPPSNERDRLLLIRDYWRTRRDLVDLEYRKMRIHYEALKQLQYGKSLPLQQRDEIFDEVDQIKTISNKDVSLEELLERVDWLEADVRECEQQIASIDLKLADLDINKSTELVR